MDSNPQTLKVQAIFDGFGHVGPYCTPFPTLRDSHPKHAVALYLDFDSISNGGSELMEASRNPSMIAPWEPAPRFTRKSVYVSSLRARERRAHAENRVGGR